ncbi:MAG: copper resistance CopC family protein [Candidatus Binataceae bacterium]
MRIRSLLRVSVLGAVLILALAGVAAAHAYPSSENPAAGAALGLPPARVVIDFGAPIEHLFSKLEVIDGKGRNEAAGAPAVSANQRELSVGLAPLRPGSYTVKWSVVAEDGHRTEGSYAFTVRPGAR